MFSRNVLVGCQNFAGPLKENTAGPESIGYPKRANNFDNPPCDTGRIFTYRPYEFVDGAVAEHDVHF